MALDDELESNRVRFLMEHSGHIYDDAIEELKQKDVQLEADQSEQASALSALTTTVNNDRDVSTQADIGLENKIDGDIATLQSLVDMYVADLEGDIQGLAAAVAALQLGTSTDVLGAVIGAELRIVYEGAIQGGYPIQLIVLAAGEIPDQATANAEGNGDIYHNPSQRRWQMTSGVPPVSTVYQGVPVQMVGALYLGPSGYHDVKFYLHRNVGDDVFHATFVTQFDLMVGDRSDESTWRHIAHVDLALIEDVREPFGSVHMGRAQLTSGDVIFLVGKVRDGPLTTIDNTYSFYFSLIITGVQTV
jgi:hypothetical protein